MSLHSPMTKRSVQGSSMAGSLRLTRRPGVLVADPHEKTRRPYGGDVRRHVGCEVIPAADGRKALGQARRRPPPSLVTMEMALAFIGGGALSEILWRDATTRAVPLIVVSGEPRPACLGRALRRSQCGLDEVLRTGDAVGRSVASHRHASRSGSTIGVRTGPRHRAVEAVGRRARARCGPSRSIVSHAHSRSDTTSPAFDPPNLRYPSCDGPPHDERSHVAGARAHYLEEWDDDVRLASCRVFQYRQRTRKLPHVS
jgi:hypothetical protein